MAAIGKTVGIIGAGTSGIISVKTALEHGLNPTAFEKRPEIGGNWNPKYGKTWHTMRTMDNKYSFHFKDMPYAGHVPETPTPKDVYEYMLSYQAKYDLAKYIKLKHKIVSAKLIEGDRWEVCIVDESAETPRKFTQIFDFFIVSCGALCEPVYPNISSMESFGGKVVHASRYRTAAEFAGKRVVVIGGAVTGGQISADLVGTASKVTTIHESPVFVAQTTTLNDKGNKKVPFNTVIFRRVCVEDKEKVEKFANVAENLLDLERFPPWYDRVVADGLYDLKEMGFKKGQTFQAFGYSNTYVGYVRDKLIDLKRQKAISLTKDGVLLANGEEIKADVVILATGSRLDFSFLDKRILKAIEYDENKPCRIHSILYKYTWAKGFRTIAFAGIWLVPGPHIILAELTAQWAFMVFSGKLPYPDESKMDHFLESMRKRRALDPEPTIPSLSCVSLYDAVAAELGALPDFDLINKTDPEFYEKLMKTAITPAHYQLSGPFASPHKARAEIENVWKDFNI